MQVRPDQQDVITQVTTAFHQGVRSILIVAPTGWGKTLVLCLVLSALVRFLKRQVRILGVAHRDRLLLQWLDAMHAVAPEYLQDLTLLNVASPRTPVADILAIDEGHHSAAKSYHEIRDRVGASYTIAVTATPTRHDRLGLSFERVICAPNLNQLMQDGVLAIFDHFALDTPEDPAQLVSAYMAEPDRWGQSIIFLPTVRSVHDAVNRLRRAGLRAAPALGDRNREAATTAFAAGDLNVLVTCHALTEGVDVPSVQSVFIRNALVNQVMQAAGRALRLKAGKIANVIQFASAPHPLVLQARPRRRWVGRPGSAWQQLPSTPIWPDLSDAIRLDKSMSIMSTHPISTTPPTTTE